MRQSEAADARDIAQRVASGRVAILGGIRHRADTDTVENNPNYAVKHNIRA